MDANSSSSNGGARGDEKSREECRARLLVSKTQQEAEKRRKNVQRNKTSRKKNAKKKGGQARKSAIKKRQNAKQISANASGVEVVPGPAAANTNNDAAVNGDTIANAVQDNSNRGVDSSPTQVTNTFNGGNTGIPTPPEAEVGTNPGNAPNGTAGSSKVKIEIDDEVNVDLLMAATPKKEAILRCFVKEINSRAAIFSKRDKMKAVEKLFSKGISVIHEFYGGDQSFRDDDLMRLYISRCQVRVCLDCKPPAMMEDIELALRYGSDRGPALQNLSDFIGYYERSTSESIGDAYQRIKEDLFTKFAFQSGSNTQSEGGVGGNAGNNVTVGATTAEGEGNGNNEEEEEEEEEEELTFWTNGSGADVLPKDKQCTWTHLEGYCQDTCCDNCSRKQIVSDWADPYYFDIHQVCATKIKGVQSPLRTVKVARKLKTSKLLNLCTECHKFLSPSTKDRGSQQWNNVWPSFYWNVLTGVDVLTKLHFHKTCGAHTLWKFIPSSMRTYWMEATKHVFVDDECVYENVDIDFPKPHFEDRTRDVRKFWEDINEYSFEGILHALDPQRLKGHENQESMIIPDVLCPWGCCEFSYRCKEFDPSLMLQHHLRSVQLNLPSGNYNKMHYVETSRYDYLRDRDEEVADTVLLNPKWSILPSMLVFPGKGPMVCTCRNCCDSSKWKRLYSHTARKEDGNNLSSRRPDDLSVAKLQPRIAKPIVAKGCNTVPALSVFTCGYGGADCASVSINGGFDNTGPKAMNYEHECLSMARPDIQQHARRLVDNGQIASEMFADWMDEFNLKSANGKLKHLTDFATYTPPVNAITLQKASSDDHRIIVTVKVKDKARRNREFDVDMSLSRSWCACIYNMQVEDPTLYGWPMKAVNIRPQKWTTSTMLSWALLGMISSCKELYSHIDQAPAGHSYKTPSGHLLTYVHHKYMKHCDSANVRKSPFIPTMTQGQLCKIILDYLPKWLTRRRGSPEKYFIYGFKYFDNILSSRLFPKVKVLNTLEGLTKSKVEGRDVLITVTKTRPNGCAHFSVGDGNRKTDIFEARVVLSVNVNMDEFNEGAEKWSFTGTRHCRHGGGKKCFRNWWHQERSPKAKNIMTQVTPPTDDMDSFPVLPNHSFYYVVVHVRLEELDVDSFKMDMHSSLGGQCSVFCDCNGSEKPLILSGMMEQEKRDCMVSSCRRRENYMCPVANCQTRMCFKCFEADSSRGKRHIITPDDPIATSSRAHEALSSSSPLGVQREDIILDGNEGGGVDSLDTNVDGNQTGRDNDTNEDDVHYCADDDDELIEAHEYDYGHADKNDANYCDEGDGDPDDVCPEGDEEVTDMGVAPEFEDDLYDCGYNCDVNDVVLDDEDELHDRCCGGPVDELDGFAGNGGCYGFRKSNGAVNPCDIDRFNALFPIPEHEVVDDNDLRERNFIDVPEGLYDEDFPPPIEYDDDHNRQQSSAVEDDKLYVQEGVPPLNERPSMGGDDSHWQSRPSKKMRVEGNIRLSAAGRHDGTNYSLLDRHVRFLHL
jgi:hypothetical protein